MATIKKAVKKAQTGDTVKGNPKGYNPKTSPLPNTINKGGYEKKLDTIGKGSTRSVRLIDGKGNVLGQERLGSSAEKTQAQKFKSEKTDTEKRRATNTSFLTSREKTGQKASKMKAGGKIKKYQTGGSLGNIYTGPAKSNPGVLKAKADKAKANANLAAYKAKSKSKK